MLTPLDIQNKDFKRDFRGYSMQEVDEFLNLVIDGYEKLYKDNIDSRDKITMLNETINQYKSMEQTLQNTLIVAQSTGDQIQRNASEKAENIIKESDNKAQQIINNAHDEVRKLTYKYEELKRSVDVYQAKMIALLDSQLNILRNVKTSDATLVELAGVNEALQMLKEVQEEVQEQEQVDVVEKEETLFSDGFAEDEDNEEKSIDDFLLQIDKSNAE